jgi:hypothetical protein
VQKAIEMSLKPENSPSEAPGKQPTYVTGFGIALLISSLYTTNSFDDLIEVLQKNLTGEVFTFLVRRDFVVVDALKRMSGLTFSPNRMIDVRHDYVV